MGYSVTYGSRTIYEPGSESYMIHDAKLGMRVDGVGTFNFTMVPDHPTRQYLKLRDLDDAVFVYFDGQLLFDGFIIRAAENFNRELEVSCVSQLQLLKDAHMRIEDHPRDNGVRRLYRGNELFRTCINAYNAIVGRQFPDEHGVGQRVFLEGHNLDNNDVGYYDEALNKYVVDGNASTPTPILDVITKSIVEPYGCLLRTWRASDGKRAIGLYLDPWQTSTQVIRFGENLTEYAKVMSTEEMYTGCLPIGGTWREYNVTYAKWLEATRTVAANTSYFWVRSLSGTIQATKGDLITLGGGTYQLSKDVDIPAYGETQVYIEGKHQDRVVADTRGYWFERGTEYTNTALTLKLLPDGFYNANAEPREDTDTDALYSKFGEVVYFRRTNQQSWDGVVGYGLKTFTFTDSDVLTAKGLFRRAVSVLGQKTAPTVTLQVDGVDMALYMDGYTHLVPGQRVRVVSEPHGVDMTMQVTQATLSLDDPGATTYVIGPSPATATQRIAQTAMEVEDVRDVVTYDINDVITGSEIMRLQ